jgi:hypothetical protein
MPHLLMLKSGILFQACALKWMDLGSILQSFISAENFSDKLSVLKFWTNFHPNTRDMNLPEYYGQQFETLTYFKAHMYGHNYRPECDKIRLFRKISAETVS